MPSGESRKTASSSARWRSVARSRLSALTLNACASSAVSGGPFSGRRVSKRPAPSSRAKRWSRLTGHDDRPQGGEGQHADQHEQDDEAADRDPGRPRAQALALGAQPHLLARAWLRRSSSARTGTRAGERRSGAPPPTGSARGSATTPARNAAYAAPSRLISGRLHATASGRRTRAALGFARGASTGRIAAGALPIPPSTPLPGGAEAAHAERLFALSQDLLGAADAHGYLRWVNAAWERTTGWTPGRALRAAVRGLHAPGGPRRR